MTSAEIRNAFLAYFAREGHELVPSSSLVPANDPTLLFTNAGMVQFKDVFLGQDKRSYRRATSSQRCVRAGGKHNDLENVGYTARHHTFFEMLGNFSFGDYFKREAIHFAWSFLTQELKLAPERLWVTVFHEDNEAEDIWLNDVGIDPARFSRLGEEDNFWSMGDTGPCGPCTEIFYDHGADVPGGPPGSPEEDGDRYIEIWNLVFMQYERGENGQLTPLPKPSVDTGMGLERIAAVLQGVHSNYEIDLFQGLLKAAADITGTEDTSHTSLRVIADHIRSCAFLITDGVVPANEGRGYVLRRIIRRAIRHGHRLGVKECFFHRLVLPLIEQMGEAYPELSEARERVEETLRSEEEQFSRTLSNGMQILEAVIANLSGQVIPGDTVFRLYDTYGFPVDLTADIARERDLRIDMAGFETAMAAQKARARSASRFESGQGLSLEAAGETHFTGDDDLVGEARVQQLFKGADKTEQLQAGDEGIVLLDSTAFYAESGGQVGDIGYLVAGEMRFRVEDTRKQGQSFLHFGMLESGQLSVGDTLSTRVDPAHRHATMLNHSATHLLHAALRQVLGKHIEQKGSLVNPHYLRFDFSHKQPVTVEQLSEIELLINEQIMANLPVNKRLMRMDEARNIGALALFGEKYADEVRVVSMGGESSEDSFSIELCGGTHVERTGDIGLFRIIQESGVAAGIRRIEAVTGRGALQHMQEAEARLAALTALVRAPREQLVVRVQQILDNHKDLEKTLVQLKGRLASAAGDDLGARAESVGEIRVLATQVDGMDAKALRETTDKLKNKLGTAVVVLGSVEADKVNLVAGVTQDLTDRIKAGELVNAIAQQVGGKGGGRPDMAMAGGSKPENLATALQSVKAFVEAHA